LNQQEQINRRKLITERVEIEDERNSGVENRGSILWSYIKEPVQDGSHTVGLAWGGFGMGRSECARTSKAMERMTTLFLTLRTRDADC
jgi:hypothetical protein